MVTRIATTTRRIVASALICGLTPRRTLEKITIGSVVDAGPDGEARDDEIVER